MSSINSVKKTIKERFSKLYPNWKLFMVVLNGFTHTVCFEDENGNYRTMVYTPYMPERPLDNEHLPELFEGIPNCNYQGQGNARKILF